MLQRLKFFFPVAALIVFLGATYLLYMEEQGNFHPITYGEAYRSAILDRDELEYYIQKYEIKSIVNLLGTHPNEPWYKEEMEVSAGHKLKHYNLSLPATCEPMTKRSGNSWRFSKMPRDPFCYTAKQALIDRG